MDVEAYNKCTDITWKGRANCKICAIRKQVIFAEVPDEAFKEFFFPIDIFCYGDKMPIYLMGEQGQSIYTIRKGLVKLYQFLPNGKQRIVRLLKPGDVAGLELLLNKTYHHFSMSMHDSELCRIPVNLLYKLQNRYPVLCRQLLERWQSGIDEADLFITLFSTGSSHARMARLLLEMDKKENRVWGLTITREDMGNILGISTETASRTIAEFKRSHLIKEKKNKIQFVDTEQLQKIAQDKKYSRM
jgi:CRP/FNR family transcriptional regulator, anaerobic regulatory protein